MDNSEIPHATDDRSRIGSFLEMGHRLNSLRSLVCDLLKTNQELRRALLEATSGRIEPPRLVAARCWPG